MASDIRFDDDRVDVEAFRVRLRAADLELDHLDRRVRFDGTAAGGDFRRAMVHGDDDTLIINFANDYSGGVVITGNVSIGGQTKLLEAQTQMLTTTGIKGLGAGTPFLDDVSQREQRSRSARGPLVDPVVRPGLIPDTITLLTVENINVGNALIELAREVLRLRNRIAELERGR